MERKVGSTFTYKDLENCLVVKLRVKKQDRYKYHCEGCFFWEKLYPCDGKQNIGSCSAIKRKDKTNVVFEEIR